VDVLLTFMPIIIKKVKTNLKSESAGRGSGLTITVINGECLTNTI
jgi:hypothetical protein